MSKFSEQFSEVNSFSDGSLVISGEISGDQAAFAFSEYAGEEITTEGIFKDWVRFGYPPEYVEDGESLGSCWYTGARQGRGAKPVWVYK